VAIKKTDKELEKDTLNTPVNPFKKITEINKIKVKRIMIGGKGKR